MTDLGIIQVQINCHKDFLFGLRSKETQRQYPKILKIFLDFILSESYHDQNKESINNSLEEKCIILYSMLKENPELVQQKIIFFINLHKKRIGEGKMPKKNEIQVL